MPKAKVKFPLDKINGTIWGQDRTIGREPGLESVCRANTTPSAADKTSGYNTKLVTKKASTRGGSVARHNRACVYNECDNAFSYLPSNKMFLLLPWWRLASNHPKNDDSFHMIWMRICLKGLIETVLYQTYCWYQRYQVWNTASFAFSNTLVTLRGVHQNAPDGSDAVAYTVFAKRIKRNGITYMPGMLDTQLVVESSGVGFVQVRIPSLAPGTSCMVDVYSYLPE